MALNQLFARDIDGTTYTVDTEYTVYTSATSGGVLFSNISILNRGSSAAAVRLYLCANGDSFDPKNAILYDASVPADGIPLQICGDTLENGGTVVFRSDTANVNIVGSGDEK